MKSAVIIGVAVLIVCFVWITMTTENTSNDSNTQLSSEKRSEFTIIYNCKKLHSNDADKVSQCIETIRGGPLVIVPTKTPSQNLNIQQKTQGKNAILVIDSNTNWSVMVTDGNLSTSSFSGSGDYSYKISCGKNNVISLNIQNEKDSGTIEIQLIQNGEILGKSYTTMDYGIASITSKCQWSLWD